MKELSAISKKYYKMRGNLGVVKRDISLRNLLEPIKCLRMWMLGFELDQYYLYNLDKNDYREYLSDSQHAMTRFINYPYDVIFNNKVIFEKIISDYISIPKTYAVINEGKILPLQAEVIISSIDTLIKECYKKGALVIKPIIGSQGNGVKILKINDGRLKINGQYIEIDRLDEYILGLENCMITEYINQGKHASSLYPDTTNTIRIAVMVDPYTAEPFIAGASQRIGGKESSGLDNFSQGGFSAHINLDTGELSAAGKKSKSLNTVTVEWYDKHPDTGNLIKGTKIPKWQSIKKEILNMMKKLPYIKYIGLDVVVTDEGIYLLEGNSHFQARVLQMHQPLLKDPRIRKFYEYYGVI